MSLYSHIGIVVPTVMEQSPLMDILEHITGKAATVQQHSIWQFHHTQLAKLHITIIHSGPGMVNAGAAAEALILHEQPQAILNYGLQVLILPKHYPEILLSRTKFALHSTAFSKVEVY